MDFEEKKKFLEFVKKEAIDLPDYEVVDVKEPKLYKDIFPFRGAPRAIFDGVVVNTNIPEKLWISDTTFRDGQQSKEPYSVEQITNLFKLLHDLGGKNGKVYYSEFFPYTKKDREAIKKCMDFGYEFPRVTGWIRATRSDLEYIKELKLEETGILASISDYHIFYKFPGKSRSQIVQNYLDVTEEALKSGITVRLHIEDVTRADIFSVVVPLVKKAMKLAERYGLPVKIRCPDTLGVGLPWPEAALPRGVPKLFWLLNKALGVPSEWLEFHGQNDFHLGVSNATSAWLYGASLNNCTLLGIGERAGNIPLEAMIFVYSMIKSSFDGMNTKVIKYITEYYEKELNYKLPYYYPIVGKNFNVTRAGIHADGLLKNLEMYLPFDTQELLDSPPRVMISEHSGLAGIAFWINTFFTLKGKEKVSKDDPELKNIQEEVVKQYQEGRVTAMLDEEVLALVKRYMPSIWEKYKERIYSSMLGS
ncbi:MAG: 2-isopropylmalate synthase [Nitrososphaerales archaeon]